MLCVIPPRAWAPRRPARAARAPFPRLPAAVLHDLRLLDDELPLLILLRALVRLLLLGQRSGVGEGRVRGSGRRLAVAHRPAVACMGGRTYVFPSEDRVAAGAVDVRDRVEARDQLPVLPLADIDIHAARGRDGRAGESASDGSAAGRSMRRAPGGGPAARGRTYTLLRRKALPCLPWKACGDGRPEHEGARTHERGRGDVRLSGARRRSGAHAIGRRARMDGAGVPFAPSKLSHRATRRGTCTSSSSTSSRTRCTRTPSSRC